MIQHEMSDGYSKDTIEHSGYATRIAALEAELRDLRNDHEILRGQLVALAEVERYRDVILSRHTPSTLPMPSSCKLGARDFAEQSDGLYYLEYGPRGETYRWTGPGHTTRIRFNVDRSVPVMVTMRLISMGSHTERDRITLHVDGTAYIMRTTAGEGTVLEAGPLSPRHTPGPTELLFTIPVLFSPGATDDQDARQLGVALQGVEIGPA